MNIYPIPHSELCRLKKQKGDDVEVVAISSCSKSKKKWKCSEHYDMCTSLLFSGISSRLAHLTPATTARPEDVIKLHSLRKDMPRLLHRVSESIDRLLQKSSEETRNVFAQDLRSHDPEVYGTLVDERLLKVENIESVLEFLRARMKNFLREISTGYTADEICVGCGRISIPSNISIHHHRALLRQHLSTLDLYQEVYGPEVRVHIPATVHPGDGGIKSILFGSDNGTPIAYVSGFNHDAPNNFRLGEAEDVLTSAFEEALRKT